MTRLMLAALAALFLAAAPASARAEGLEGDHIPTEAGDIVIHPVRHASFYIGWNGVAVAVDPVGGAEAYAGLPVPNLILVTHGHHDHFDLATLSALMGPETRLVAPRAVALLMPDSVASRVTALDNGGTAAAFGIGISAVPAYNLDPEKLRYHPTGAGNGYVLGIGGKRIYISGDTENVPELRDMPPIDIAFICMNMPYTMDMDQAVAAAKAIHPAILYPYHYRGSDLSRLTRGLAEEGIDIRLRNWYPD
jgi:L-ascorbate metabolism protein UlaG (beta-lactamase superfamily)